MLTASASYQAALTNSHISRVRVKAYRRDANWGKSLIATIPVIDGTLTIDGGGNYWRTLDAVFANDYVSSDGTRVSDIINAYDTELRVEFGVQLDWDWDEGGPAVEYIKVATLNVDRVVRKFGTQVQVTATDYGSMLGRYPLLYPWPNTTDDDLDRDVVNTIKQFVEDCYPAGAEPSWTVVGTYDETWAEGSRFAGDRAEQVRTLADGIGVWVHNDEDGDWVIEPLPELGTAVLTLDEGNGGTVTRVDMDENRDELFNAVYVRCETPTGGSVIALAQDTDANSPTYWDGAFGKQIKIIESDIVISEAQADEVGAKLLRQYQGRGFRLDVGSVYNPLLIPGDTVEIRTPTGVLETHVIDVVNLPIPAGEMTLETRLVEAVPP